LTNNGIRVKTRRGGFYACQYSHSGSVFNKQGKNAALWVLQILGAAMFFMSSFMKLSGNEQMVQMFDVIGIGQWFRYGTGLIEVSSAILLLLPALSGVGALLLIPSMIGAILTHLFIIGGSPALPIALLIAMSFVAWGRRERTLRLIKR
jgi:putative oxidoreductase